MTAMLMPVFLLVGFVPCFFDFLLLFLNQECLHGIIVVMVMNKFGQLSFFLQHWPLWLFIVAAFVVGQVLAFLALEMLPSNSKLVLVLVVARLVSRVVYSYQPSTDFGSTEIIYREIAAFLVFIFEPAEAL